MPGRFNLLEGVLVVEVAQLGPDAVGGYLADMGARVIKVETPPGGDPVRFAGKQAIGEPNGVGLLHLRWNRGKESLGLDLRDEAGAAVFKRLIAQADVVIDGMRAGALDRLGLGYAVLEKLNKRLVCCSLSGFGLSGRYHELGSHGPSFDAFGGLSIRQAAKTSTRPDSEDRPPIGMHAMGLFAAMGTLSALVRARETGKGALVEVAAADVAANWLPDGVDAALNPGAVHDREGFGDEAGRMMHWPRFAQYQTADGKLVFLQALKDKFWLRFCAAVNRPDLQALRPEHDDLDTYHATLWRELAALFKSRDRSAWMELFLTAQVPGHPVNDAEDLAVDPHFLDRQCFYDVSLPEGGGLRLTGTPIKLHGQSFAPELAPGFGQHTDQVLGEFLAMSSSEIEQLRAKGVAA